MAQILPPSRHTLSQREISDATALRLSFGPNDAAIIDTDAAPLFDPEGDDVRAVIEADRALHRAIGGEAQAGVSFTGSLRIRRPVAAKIALVTAGASAEVPGSPMPPGAASLCTKYTLMAGASLIRSKR